MPPNTTTRVRRKQVIVHVTADTDEQLRALTGVLNLPRSAVVTLAIGRMYHAEPLVKKEKDGNGVHHPPV